MKKGNHSYSNTKLTLLKEYSFCKTREYILLHCLNKHVTKWEGLWCKLFFTFMGFLHLISYQFIYKQIILDTL